MPSEIHCLTASRRQGTRITTVKGWCPLARLKEAGTLRRTGRLFSAKTENAVVAPF
jgi:hypothetical protein